MPILSISTILYSPSSLLYELTRITISILVLGFIFMWPYYYLKSKIWESRILPRFTKSRKEHFRNAYICAAVLLIRADHRDLKTKQRLVTNKLKEMGFGVEGIVEIWEKVLEKEVSSEHVASWIRVKFSQLERTELLYLLIEFVLVDGFVISNELEVLRDFADEMNISFKEVQRMVSSHKQKVRREKAKRDEQERMQRNDGKSRSKKALLKAFQILGVSSEASRDEIKKAYRSLVKKHHPDRLVGKDPAIVRAAMDQFIEI